MMTLEAGPAGTSVPGRSNLVGKVPGEGTDEYSTCSSRLGVRRGVNTPPCKRSIVAETSNTDTLTQHDLGTRRLARRIMYYDATQNKPKREL